MTIPKYGKYEMVESIYRTVDFPREMGNPDFYV